MYIGYTDGSYKSSTGQGGYASIITLNNEVVEKLYQGFTNTTNNRMELLAVLETLKYFKTATAIHIFSDSQYVVNSLNQGHVEKWFLNNDLSKKNLDLWFEVIDLLKLHKVTFEWVKGHSRHKMNEMANLYAQHAADCINPIEDKGFSQKFISKNNDS